MDMGAHPGPRPRRGHHHRAQARPAAEALRRGVLRRLAGRSLHHERMPQGNQVFCQARVDSMIVPATSDPAS
eukprot:16449629-Heterocapsa_arctica.AAC.1